MDKKFYYVNENLICSFCGSDKIVSLEKGNFDILNNIVKCSNCGKIMYEEDLIEKENNKNEL